MDPELVTLASSAASAVVQALTTTAWEHAAKAVGSLWRRAHPDRVRTVEAELAEAREHLVAARQANDDQAERDLVTEWQSRLRRLLATDPRLADDLRQVVDQLRPTSPEDHSRTLGRVDMYAEAHDHGTVNQAAGDQHITITER